MSKLFRGLAWVIGILAVIVGIARAFAIRWVHLPDDDAYLSASITPSLDGGDFVLLWRLGTPSKGDLVICPEPEHPERMVIGRILAGEGENIVVAGNTVKVDGKLLPVEAKCLEPKFTVNDPQSGIEHQLSCALEVSGGRTHMRGNTDETFPVSPVEGTVDEDRVYLVSDNRQFPYDSRDFGTVALSQCKETIFFRLMSREGMKDSEHRFNYVR